MKTLAVSDHDTALGLAVLSGAVCPCGRAAVRVIVERPPRRKVRPYGVPYEDAGAVLRTWCGDVALHNADWEDGPYGADPDTVAMTEDDM